MTKPLDDMFKSAEEPAKPSLVGSAIKTMVPAVGTATGLSALLSGGQPSASEIESEVISDLLDPEHEATMQRIRMQAMLTEFMADDPVISTYDPDQVIEAFNQVAQMTPRAAIQPAIMRGQLRKMLQQQDAMEPFEAGQLIDVERGLKDIAAPAELPIAGLPEVSKEEKKREEG
jgi:hypothetical protein